MRLALILLLAYFAGSINFAIIILRLLDQEDPRTKFSGNAGTTNVYRQAGKGWAAVVLLLDAGRAVGLAALALWSPARRPGPLGRNGPGRGEPFPLFSPVSGRQGGRLVSGIHDPDRPLGGLAVVPRLGRRLRHRADSLHRLLLHDPDPRRGDGIVGRSRGGFHHRHGGHRPVDFLQPPEKYRHLPCTEAKKNVNGDQV